MMKFLWKSPLCQIESVDIRVSRVTQNRYAVVRVKACATFAPLQRELHEKYGNQTTLLCFKECLLMAFFPGSINYFEGEVEFNWGNTYLKITKFFTDTGARILKPGGEVKPDPIVPPEWFEEGSNETEESIEEAHERRVKDEEEAEENAKAIPERFFDVSAFFEKP